MSGPYRIDHTSWAVNSFSWEIAERLAHALGLPLIAGMVLAGRGFADPGEAQKFLDCSFPLPDPFLFADMEGAVTTICGAIERRERVVIHGDYDADGITATAVMVLGLRDLGLEAEWYLPSRFNEGYGLSRQAVESIAGSGPALVVTVDCGVNYPAEVALAKDMGLDVVVVDHHRPGPKLPECHVIHEAVGEYPHGDLCGVGLALKVLHAIHIRSFGASRDALPERLHSLLDLVAIGTIADLASLRGENRYYVKEGLKLVAIGQRLGVRVLTSVARCGGTVDSGTVAYRLAPRLNAAGRLADPSPPLRLLLTDDEREAEDLAAQLHELNGARQDVERQMLDEAITKVEHLDEIPPALVLAGEEWHEGVVGIVASRLVERYHRPAILLGIRDGVAKGSGRSIPAYDLMCGLNACAGHLTVYGGHRQAVGLTLDAARVGEFSRAIAAHAGKILEARDFVPVYRADAVLRGEDVTSDTATALASLGPFGTGNPKPRLLVAGGHIAQAEATRNGGHLRCSVDLDGVRVRGVGFGMGNEATAIRDSPGPRLLGVQLRVDEWQGTLRPEFLIERLGPAGDLAETTGGCEHVLGRPRRPVEPTKESSECTTVIGGAESLRLPRARDLRGARGLPSAVAQVLACGERAMLVTCSTPHAVQNLQEHVPLCALWGSELKHAGRGSAPADLEAAAMARIAVAEWDTAAAVLAAGPPRMHTIVLDPPFRAEHMDFLRLAEDAGGLIHLCYGAQERQATARLLRYLVHPRYAMVCLYRAMRDTDGARDGLFARAAQIGWQEAGVVLTWKDLSRAREIMDELGVERLDPGEAKLEVRSVPAYVNAEAEYEECSRLCLIL